MTKREAKAVEILQSFDKPCGSANMEMILRAMQWQTEQCVELCTEVFDQYETRALPVDMEERIINAGTEEV